MTEAERHLFESAAEPYKAVGRGPYTFAKMKLRSDPVYAAILRQGLLPASGRILDLGCGQGLTLAAVIAAQRAQSEGTLPEGWRRPPSDVELWGMDVAEAPVRIARQALGERVNVRVADLRTAELPPCHAVLLLDVLHYMDESEQENLLGHIAQALSSGGVVIIREADASAGWGFAAVRHSESLRAVLRGQWEQRFHYRSAEGWARLLASFGLEPQVQEMGRNTPFKNVLVCGRVALPANVA